MLHRRRQRVKTLVEAEAAGQSFWTKQVSEAVRHRLWYAIQDASAGDPYTLDEAVSEARRLIMTDEGLPFLSARGLRDLPDFQHYVLACDDDMLPTVIEAAYAGFIFARKRRTVLNDIKEFEEAVNLLLNEARISYELVRGQVRDFESKELHEALVVPTLQLLSGRADLAAVETAYQHALEEISNIEYADAITDAGTALQEMLKTLGCQGNQLDPLAKSALGKKLITGYDLKLVDWVAADRSTKGDAHNAQPATRDDAWFAVHVVGAFILRLAANPSRLP